MSPQPTTPSERPLRLFIPVGLPACGKSSYFRSSLEAVKVSTDDLREGVNKIRDNDLRSQEFNWLIFPLFYGLVDMALQLGSDVYADATNLGWESRADLREIAERYGADTNLILFKNVDQAIQRNARREDWEQVPGEAMERMIARYEDTLLRLPQESYTTVTKVESFA